MEGFVLAVRNGRPYPGLLREGYNATVAVLLGLQAMQESCIIEWSEEYVWKKNGALV